MTPTLTLLTALLLAPLAALHAADTDKSAYKTPPGKSYVYKQSGGKLQSLEVYFPANHDIAKRVPGILLFHGGGWSGGDLDQFRHACQYYASRGLVAATANYRTLSKAEDTKPDGVSQKMLVCITDAKSAIRWIKLHAAELGIDPNRLIVGGGSAGGHISILATINPGLNDPQDPPGIDTSVAAYVEFNPAIKEDTKTEGADAPGDKRKALIDSKTPPDAVPFGFATASMAPGIHFFGSGDGYRKGALELQAKLATLGNHDLEIWFAPGQSHGFFNQPPWGDVTLAESDRWLVAHGFLTGQTTLIPPASGEKLIKSDGTETSTKGKK